MPCLNGSKEYFYSDIYVKDHHFWHIKNVTKCQVQKGRKQIPQVCGGKEGGIKIFLKSYVLTYVLHTLFSLSYNIFLQNGSLKYHKKCFILDEENAWPGVAIFLQNAFIFFRYVYSPGFFQN